MYSITYDGQQKGAGLLKIVLQLCCFSLSLAALNGQEVVNLNTEQELLLDNPLESNSVQTIASVGGFAALMQAIFALLFVLALVYVTLRILRKLSGKEAQVSSSIQVLDTHSLKAGAHVSVVEVANRLFVLGVAESITKIAEITDQEQIDLLKLQHSQKDNQPNLRFIQLLKERISPRSQNSTKEPKAQEMQPKKDFLKDYTSRLNTPTPINSTKEDSPDDE